MKSFAELKEMKEVAQKEMELRTQSQTEIYVAVGTCGVAAGVEEIVQTIKAQLAKEGLDNVTVTKRGCIGLCHQEPIVEISKVDSGSVLYGQIGVAEAKRLVKEHLVNDEVVEELVVN